MAFVTLVVFAVTSACGGTVVVRYRVPLEKNPRRVQAEECVSRCQAVLRPRTDKDDSLGARNWRPTEKEPQFRRRDR